jgi:uncharacterized protein
LARIEVGSSELKRFLLEDLMEPVYNELRKIGFTYVALDMKGYRTGSMNEAITEVSINNKYLLSSRVTRNHF